MPHPSKFNVVVVAIGGFLIGYVISILFVLRPVLTEVFHLDQSLKSLWFLLPVPGYLIGALWIGRMGNKYSRRSVLKILGMLFIIASVGNSAANSFVLFLLFQIAGGVAIGGTSVIAPVYIAEISPVKDSGISRILFPVFIVFGILSGLSFELIPDEEIQNLQRWIQLSPALPSILFFILLHNIKRSPQWLITQGLHGEAFLGVSEINSKLIKSDVEKVINGIDNSVFQENDSNLSDGSFKNVLTGIFISMFFQFSGFVAILVYAPEIFLHAGFKEDSFRFMFVALTLLTGIVVAILSISGFGRKAILLTGSFGMFVFLAALSYVTLMGIGGFLSIILMAGYLMCFVFSLGSLIWLILPDLFNTNNRIKGVAVVMFSFWLFFAIGLYLAPLIQKSFNSAMGVVFAVAGLYSLINIYFCKKYLFKFQEYLKDEIEKFLVE